MWLVRATKIQLIITAGMSDSMALLPNISVNTMTKTYKMSQVKMTPIIRISSTISMVKLFIHKCKRIRSLN